jgi:hypothetical protein
VDELVKLVTQKTGLSEDMAQVAVDTVIGYLKDKLPDSIASQIDVVLEGGSAQGLDGIAKGLGGLLG